MDLTSVSPSSNIKKPVPLPCKSNYSPIEATAQSQDNDTNPNTKNLVIKNNK